MVPMLAPITAVGIRAAAPVNAGTEALAVLLALEVWLFAADVLLWLDGPGVMDEFAAE